MGGSSEDLMKRIKDLELNQVKLKDELDSLTIKKEIHQDTDDNEHNTSSGVQVGLIPGYYVRSPYYNVLNNMGLALYIYRPETGVIIFWNRAAENLYGWEEQEVLGNVVPELLIDEEKHSHCKDIFERLQNGQSWFGHIPFKNRTGEMFMAMVTKSPLYDNNAFVGVITIAHDSIMFTDKYKGKYRMFTEQQRNKASTRRIQWNQRPQITSSISDLASKVFPNNRMSSDSENEAPNKGSEFVSRIRNLMPDKEVNRHFGQTASQACKEKIPFISKATRIQMNEVPYKKSQN